MLLELGQCSSGLLSGSFVEHNVNVEGQWLLPQLAKEVQAEAQSMRHGEGKACHHWKLNTSPKQYIVTGE